MSPNLDFKSLGLSATGSMLDASGIGNLKIGGVNVGGQIQSSFMNSIYTAFQDGVSSEDKLKSIGTQFAGIPLQIAQKIVMDKVKSALKGIFAGNAAAEATADTGKQISESAESEADIQAQQSALEQTLSNTFANVEEQNEVLNITTEDMENVNQQLEEEKQAAEAIKKEIDDLQKTLQCTQDPKTQLDLLNQIQSKSVELITRLSTIALLNDYVTELSQTVEDTSAVIEEESGNLEETLQEGQENITAIAEEVQTESANATATSVEGGVHEGVGASLHASAASLTAGTLGIGSAAAAKVEREAIEQTTAGSIDFTGSSVVLKQVMRGIGGLVSNTDLLSSFQNSIGSELSKYADGIGAWNGAVESFMEGFGSIKSEEVTAQVGELQSAVVTDIATVNSKGVQENSESEPSDTEENGMDFTKTIGQATSTLNIYNENQNELLTPNVKLSFGV